MDKVLKTSEAKRQTKNELKNNFEYAAEHFDEIISKNSPIGISLLSAKQSQHHKWGQWLVINPTMCQIVGYTEKEMQQKTFMDITHPDDIHKNLEVTKSLLEGEVNTVQWEKRYIHKYGHTIWIQQNVSLLRDNKGNPQYFLSLTHDITERKEMEQKLKDNDERFQLVQKATGDMIWDWDLVNDKIHVSDNMKTHFKYDPEYVENQVSFMKWWKERIHPEDRETIISMVEEAFEKQQQFLNLEYRFLRGDGEYAFLLGRTYILYKNGKPVRAIGANQDITHRKESELSLRQSEERYSLVVNHVKDLVTILDPEANYIYASPSHKQILGYDQEELKGINALTLIHPDDLPRLNEQYRKILKGDSGSMQYRVRHKDGHYVVLEGSGKAILDLYDKPYVLVITSDDISERIELDKRKNNFIRMASHELKTPLTSLRGMIQLLEKHVGGDDTYKKYLDQINIDIAVLVRLVQSLLDESSLSAGELDLRYEKLRLDKLLKDAAVKIESGDPSHNIIFDQISPVEITGDKYRLSQVFVNLLNNAIKFSPDSDRVLVSISQSGEIVTVSIQDFGVGVSKSDQKKIFEPFYRVEQAVSGSRMGLGIGLHIASEMVKRHKGIIEVQSDLGKGSIFTVRLPSALYVK